MSLVTFAGQGPALTIEAPSVPSWHQLNSSRMADNFSDHLLHYRTSALLSAALAQRQDSVQQQSSILQRLDHFLNKTAELLQRIYLFIFSSVFLKSSQTLKARTLAYCWC